MELKDLLITLTVIGLMITGLSMFIAPWIKNYAVPEQSVDKYNFLTEMINEANQTENKMKGLDALQTEEGPVKRFTSLVDFIIGAAYDVFLRGLSSLSTLFQLFKDLAVDLNVPSSLLLGVFSLITISVIFALAKLFIQVIGR